MPLIKSMGLTVDEGGVNKLVKEHSEEVTMEELNELQTQHHAKVLQETDTAEETEVEGVISTSEIKEILEIWQRLSEFVETPRKTRNWLYVSTLMISA